jgi:Protein of unknown function (DUF4238)
MQRSMQQHWLPRAYLAAWCDADTPVHQDPYIWIFPKEGGEGRAKSPKKVFRESNLYTDAEESEHRKYWLERGLQKIEDGFKWVRDHRIVKRKLLRPQDLAAIHVFAATILVRSPRYRDHMRAPWEQVVRIADDLQAAYSATPPHKRRRFPAPITTSDGPSLSIEEARIAAKRPLQTLVGPYARNVAKILAHMHHAVLCTRRTPGFITSDNPFMHFDPDAWRRPAYMRGGLGWKNVEVTLPITPQYMIMLGWEPIHGYVELPDGAVD